MRWTPSAERAAASGRLSPHEAVQLLQERRPGGLLGGEDVVAAVEQPQRAVRDQSRPARGPARWAPGGRCGRARTRVGHCTRVACSSTSMLAKVSRNRTTFSVEVVARCRALNASQVARPSPGKNWAAKTCRYAGSSRRQATRPICRSSGGLLALLGRLRPGQPTPRVGADQDQPGHALRMPHGVRDGHRAALREADQREPLEPRRVHHQLEVLDPRVEVEGLDVPVRQPAATLVVADQPVSSRERVDPVRPDRALPLQVEVGQPVRRLDQRRPGSRRGVRDFDPVVGPAVPDLLRPPFSEPAASGGAEAPTTGSTAGSVTSPTKR